MPFIDFVKETMTGKPAKIDGPIFLKEKSDVKHHLDALLAFRGDCPASMKSKLERDIKLLSYGIYGEKQIAFELKNSFQPIIVLHDLHLQYKGLEGQIDYLIVTNREIVVVECKNLVGNIEVNNRGDFIRTTIFNGKKKREGIYSPITQNRRHMELLKKILVDRQENFIRKKSVEFFFEENYKSVVVLANPKTVINMKYAKKSMKEQIIRCDQLNAYLNELKRNSKLPISTSEEMFAIASRYLDMHHPVRKDYLGKYKIEEKQVIAATAKETESVYEKNDGLEDALKAYRVKKSREEGIKAYYIYNNAQMADLITGMPKSKKELMKVSGFGRIKCEKYGEDILAIIRAYFY